MVVFFAQHILCHRKVGGNGRDRQGQDSSYDSKSVRGDPHCRSRVKGSWDRVDGDGAEKEERGVSSRASK